MPPIGAVGAIGGFAAPPLAAAASAAAPAGAAAAFAPGGTAGTGSAGRVAPASGPAEGLLPAGAVANGLDDLEALAILALLAGNRRHHGAEALSAMVIALALNAYTGVQSMASAPVGQPGGTAAGAGLHLTA